MAKIVLEFEKPIEELEQKLEEMRSLSETVDLTSEIAAMSAKVEELRSEIYQNLTRWQRVQLARHPDRPYSLDYIMALSPDFVELHGDRSVRDDPAIVGGFGTLDEIGSVLWIGHQKGRDTKQNVYRNFGMPNPEGYRKALRLMKLAEKFGKPVITLLDTPGAFPGIEAEERGQAEAIARNLFEMARLKVPIIVVIIGEGASGGALGIGLGDRILMMENAWYSVISPESCSSILWRSWDYKEQAAEALKLTAIDMLSQGIIDRIIPEPLGGAHRAPETVFQSLKEILIEEISALHEVQRFGTASNLERRTEKFGCMGVWQEEAEVLPETMLAGMSEGSSLTSAN
ncbi:MAG: acetyl-CoA carboxylase carboxyltransferase subunit alpha [Bacteroidota bacterium]|nr:acetyl-CoA carboxylase carboxyltransferase subunit alpha [Bacteroidota bacterium]MDP4233027.1 acetyl-CoA carboxylase carboxyltransferase subunit alpha [Bacteroidota bacterium]MDP4241828.1 acetyl-CoA carboxylase carboxyltransferase subunit alpha [Bacteroidota bacterium]MDP4288377.1 acetyl-CoA carboxylase carboxyltransferase subunit alpha [Bacteroidota bacterium]